VSFQSSLKTVFVSSLLLAGCDSTPDKGPTHPNEVKGSRVLHYRTDQGDFTQPAAASTTGGLEAFVVEGGERRALQVETAEDGTFRIPDAPAGKYYLRDGTFHVYTDSRTVNLDSYELGRQDTQKAVMPPTVDLTLSNLLPQTDETYPSWQAVSPNAGLTADIYAQGPLTAGTTSVSRLAADYFRSSPLGEVLLDSARGDVLYVTGHTESESDGFSFTAVDRFFTQQVTMREGELTHLEGVFQTLPSKSLALDWRLSDFDAFAAQVNPKATVRSQNLSVQPTAGSADTWYGYSGELVNVSTTRPPTTNVVRFSYGNPYPANWGEVISIAHRVKIDFALPGTVLITSSYGLSDTRPVADAVKGPLTPRLSPARELTVEDRDAQQEHTLGSFTPHIAWKAPQVGTPSVYHVQIRRRSVQEDLTFLNSVAVFSTTETALDLPPGVLKPGEQYVFSVKTWLSPGLDLSTQVYGYQMSTDLAEADTVSGVFTAPASLGAQRAGPVPEPVLTSPDVLEFKARRASREH
jgi:hypothetical protein